MKLLNNLFTLEPKSTTELPIPLLRKAVGRYATFMRNILLTILLLLFSPHLHSQVIGRIALYDEGAWSMISVNKELPYQNTDSKGNFKLNLPNTKNDIFILSSWISIEIKNVPKSLKANLGEIRLPMRKSISIKEYDSLSSKDKGRCIPVRHWAELLGYEFKDQLSEPSITVKCGKTKYEISKFDFDIENQKVVIDWNNFRVCEE
jgi:hypothetical protein